MANYVKFLRGNSTDYANLQNKDRDTLYFIYDEDKLSGQLYLGSKLIAGSGVVESNEFLSDLKDILISENVEANDCLVYDASGKWVNKPIDSILPIFVGTDGEVGGMSGIVPAPAANEADMFLRSDGTWAKVVTDSIEADNLTLENSNGVLSIAGFKDALEGAYPVKNQDGSLTWIQPDLTAINNLQSDVDSIKQILNPVDEDGNAVEGGLVSDVQNIGEELKLKANAEEINDALDLKANAFDMETALNLKANTSDVETALNLKANASDVYTKEAADSAIAAAIANIDHLSREIVDILPDIEDADPNIIYMTPSGLQEDDNKYYEWILINSVFEQVGSWEVDLKDYATKENLQDLANIVAEKADIVHYTVVDKETGETIEVPGEFLSPEDREKLAALVVDKDGNVGMSGSVNADNVEGLGTWLTKNGNTYITNLSENNLSQEIVNKLNFITSVDGDNFTVTNGELKLNKIAQSQVDGLEEILASSATVEGLNAVISDVSELDKILNGYVEDEDEVPGLIEQFFQLNNKVAALEQKHGDFITTNVFNSTVSDLNTLINANADNIETLTNSVNTLDEHLTWQDLK